MGNESKISNLSLLVVQYLAPYEPTPSPLRRWRRDTHNGRDTQRLGRYGRPFSKCRGRRDARNGIYAGDGSRWLSRLGNEA